MCAALYHLKIFDLISAETKHMLSRILSNRLLYSNRIVVRLRVFVQLVTVAVAFVYLADEV